DEVAAFEGSVRFVFPLLPLGRMQSLLSLVSLQTLDREGSLLGAEGSWAKAEALLQERAKELEATLARVEADRIFQDVLVGGGGGGDDQGDVEGSAVETSATPP